MGAVADDRVAFYPAACMALTSWSDPRRYGGLNKEVWYLDGRRSVKPSPMCPRREGGG